MTMWGADVGVLDGLASQFMNAAATLDTLRANVGAELGRVDWSGSDAQRSREQWQRVSSPALLAASGMLRECSNAVKAAATKQRQASDAVGGGVNARVSNVGGRHEQTTQVSREKKSSRLDRAMHWLGDAAPAVHAVAHEVARVSGDLARIASDSSTVLQVGAIAVAVVSVVEIGADVATGQVELIPAGIAGLELASELHDDSEAVGTVATELQDVKTTAEGVEYGADLVEQTNDRGRVAAENQATQQARVDRGEMESDAKDSIEGNLGLLNGASSENGGDE